VRRRAGTRTPTSPPVRLPPRATWRSQARAYGASPGQHALEKNLPETGHSRTAPLSVTRVTLPRSSWRPSSIRRAPSRRNNGFYIALRAIDEPIPRVDVR
jgi:hypothetical protein